MGRLQVVDRALVMLEELADAPGGLGVSELGRRLGIDKSTAYRLLATMLARGFIRLNPYTQRYALGLRLAGLGAAVVRSLELTEIARPYLEALRDDTSEAAHLAVLSEGEVMFLAKAAGPDALTVNAGIGTCMPAHCSALGKVLLAGLRDEAQIDHIIAQHGLRRYTPRTIVDRDDLLRHLRQVAAHGWALDDEEYALGLRALAAPVRDATGSVVAAVSLSGPTGRVTLGDVDRLSRRVLETGHAISSAMSRHPRPGPPASARRANSPAGAPVPAGFLTRR